MEFEIVPKKITERRSAESELWKVSAASKLFWFKAVSETMQLHFCQLNCPASFTFKSIWVSTAYYKWHLSRSATKYLYQCTNFQVKASIIVILLHFYDRLAVTSDGICNIMKLWVLSCCILRFAWSAVSPNLNSRLITTAWCMMAM